MTDERPSGCKCPKGWWRCLDAKPICKKYELGPMRIQFENGKIDRDCANDGHVRACHKREAKGKGE